MKSLKDLVETKKSSSFSFTSSDVVKYVDSPLIKDLKLSSKEFRQNFMIIKQMVDEYEKCNKLDDRCCNESNYHIKLIRDQNNNLQIISVPCEKLERILQVKSKYLIRNFSNKYLKVLLNPQSIGKLVSPTKAKLLDIYQKYLNENELKHGLYVYGTMGTGKTFTSIALANELALKNKTIAFIFVPDFTYELKQGISKGDSTNANYIDKMREADVLFLDDLGAESTNE
jgi:primosomal protein DnaI